MARASSSDRRTAACSSIWQAADPYPVSRIAATGRDRACIEHAKGKGMVGRRLIHEAMFSKRFAAESEQTAASASQGTVFPDGHIPQAKRRNPCRLIVDPSATDR